MHFMVLLQVELKIHGQILLDTAMLPSMDGVYESKPEDRLFQK